LWRDWRDFKEGTASVPITSFQGREEQILYSATTFRHLLDSLARPGKLNQLEYPTFLGEPPCYYSDTPATEVPLNFYALGALSTLLDGETHFILAANGRWLDQTTPAVQWLALRTGANVAIPGAADFALFCDGKSDGLLSELSPGTLLEPETSTTAFYCVEQLTADNGGVSVADARKSIQLKLTGPGIQEARTVGVPGMEQQEIELIQATRRLQYPKTDRRKEERHVTLSIPPDMEEYSRTTPKSSSDFVLGIDIYFVDNTGRCLGLPRTTRITVI
jgi:alpha-D-ribose 1-methylphosphonate 5-triphosphate synthase subunit PhnH